MQDLSDKQLAFIDAYLSEQDINKVCKKLNITRPTYYKYLNDDAVKQEISKIRLATIEKTARYLQDNLSLCSQELVNIIKSKDTAPQIKINAINSIFNNCSKLTEQVDIINELDRINQRLQEQEDKSNGGI
jgi:ACT domain-containing protein